MAERGISISMYTHEATGAQVMLVDAPDANKVFSANFRTLPKDNTGVPHILEHSVLCGSKRYPSKEPFVDLLKGSLKTFLNAMTAADKTMYPVASQNKQDFFNLVNVYLDACLNPRILDPVHGPRILKQARSLVITPASKTRCIRPRILKQRVIVSIAIVSTRGRAP